MTVEDGTIVSDADSYVDITFADGYFTSRGETAWASLTDDEKSVYLVKGTDFIDTIYQWQGKKSAQNQSLNFPRTGLVDLDGYKVEGIPKRLKQAVCIAAQLIRDNGDLFQTEEANGAVVSESIGSISFSYDVSKKVKDSTLYQQINVLLRGLYVDRSKQRHLVGAIRKS